MRTIVLVSTTIRVSKKDKEVLESLRRRLGTKTLAETLRRAISLAEENEDTFKGDTQALREALSFSRPSGSGRTRVSEHVDEELENAILGGQAEG